MSTLEVNKLTPLANNGTVTMGDSGDTISIPSGVTIANAGTATGFGGGKIGQVVSVTKTDTFTYSGTGLADVTGLSLSITPVATSSKIYLVANINIGSNARYTAFKFVRGSTDIGIGNAEGNRARVTVSSFSNPNLSLGNYQMPNSSASFLDSPSTGGSAVTYKIQAGNTYENKIVYINRPEFDDNNTYIHRGISTLTAMEILA